jgi:hypothetical protein
MARYPHIEVELIGQNGNAFVIIAAVSRALRKHKVPAEEVTEFREEAMSGDYNHLLQTAMDWVEVC